MNNSSAVLPSLMYTTHSMKQGETLAHLASNSKQAHEDHLRGFKTHILGLQCQIF